MKNILSISILALCSNSINVSAQSDVAFFQVNNTNYMQAHQLKPQTLVECYSQNEGGVYQGTVQVSGNSFTASFPTVGAPKMFINRKTDVNTNGTNKVYFFDDKEFWLHHILLQSNAQHTLLTWQATVFNKAGIAFKVLQSINNAPYSEVAIINAQNNNADNNYEFTLPAIANAFYQIEVINTQFDRSRYTTPYIKSANITGLANVYPTHCTTVLQVAMLGNYSGSSYQIFNTAGKKVASNNLITNITAIDVSNLQSGIYWIQLWINNKKEVYSFIKE